MMSEKKNNCELRNTLSALKNLAALSQEQIDVIDLNSHFDKLDAFGGQFFFLFDFAQSKYIHFSQNAEEFWGINLELTDRLGVVGFMNEFVHPDDLTYCATMVGQFMAFVKLQPQEKIKDYRAILSYRIKNQQGEYVRVLEHNSVVQIANDGNVLINMGAVSILPLIPNDMLTAGAVIDITTGEQLVLLDQKTTQVSDLTDREKQIIGLIAVGYMNKEIADQLFISLNTVETHRKKIKRKLKISSSVEFVWKAIQLNLIMS